MFQFLRRNFFGKRASFKIPNGTRTQKKFQKVHEHISSCCSIIKKFHRFQVKTLPIKMPKYLQVADSMPPKKRFYQCSWYKKKKHTTTFHDFVLLIPFPSVLIRSILMILRSHYNYLLNWRGKSSLNNSYQQIGWTSFSL